MRVHPVTFTVTFPMLLCAVVACGGDAPATPTALTEPHPGPTRTPKVIRLLTSVRADVLLPGDSTHVELQVESGNGFRPASPSAFVLATDDPAVATVAPSGVVRAVGPGRTTIRARVGGTGHYSYSDANLEVVHVGPPGEVWLTQTLRGFIPESVAVDVGTTVRWFARHAPTEPGRGQWIRLDPLGATPDSVEVRNGVAARRFTERGVIEYCLACCDDCWGERQYLGRVVIR